jgi:TPR repeat protein
MKRCVMVTFLAGVLLAGLLLSWPRQSSRPDPQDLSAWARFAGERDWSSQAAQGDSEAEFLLGLTLVRTNLTQMVDRVPTLSAIPVVGKRFFEKVHYGLDAQVTAEQMAEAHRWIQRSAEQGYAPAREAVKLFAGRLADRDGRE